MRSEVECSDVIRQQVMQQKRQDEEDMPHICGTNPHRSFAGRSEGFKKISKVLCDWDQDVMRTAKPAVHASKIMTNSWNSQISNSYKFLQILTYSYKFLHILTNFYEFLQILQILAYRSAFPAKRPSAPAKRLRTLAAPPITSQIDNADVEVQGTTH